FHAERDDQIARRSTVRALAALPLEAHARSGVDTRRHGDAHGLLVAHLADAAARRARLGRDLTAAQTHRARAIHGETTLAERDRAASAALGARLQRRAGCRAIAVARRTLLGDLELHRHLAA